MELVVALQTGDEVVALNGELNVVCRYKLGEGSGPRRVCAKNERLYVANSYDGSIVRIDVNANKTVTRHVCSYPTGVGVFEDGLAVACGETNSVYILDLDLKLKRMVGAPGFPISLSVCANALCVTRLYARKVTLLSLGDFSVMADIDIDGYPNCAIASESSVWCAYADEGYFTNGHIARTDLRGRLVARSKTGSMPGSIVLSNGLIYCANSGADTLSVYDAQTLKPAGVIKTPSMPDDIVAHGGDVYVSCMIDGVIVRYTNGAETARRYVGGEPRGLTLLETARKSL